MWASIWRTPNQNWHFVLACHHTATNADIHHAGVEVLGDAASVGEQVAPAVEPVPPRRRQLIKVDIVSGDDVLFHRARADDLWWNAAVEHVATELDQIARMGVGSDAEHHGDTAITCEPAAEHAPAARICPVILDVV